MALHLCRHKLAAGICIPRWSHHGRGVSPSFRIAVFAIQCQYIKFSLSLTGLCAFSGYLSTVHTTYFKKLGRTPHTYQALLR